MKVELLVSTPDPLRLMYAQTRGTTTSKGFAAVYRDPPRFFKKEEREKRAEMRKVLDDKAAKGFAHYSPVQESHIIAFDKAEMIRLVTEAINAGHMSVTRGVHFTFAFEVSRSMGRQMLRHVVGVSWEEMSQRYVKLASRQTLARLHAAVESAALNESGSYENLMATFGEFFEIPEHLDGDALAFDWFRTRHAEIAQYVKEIEAGVPAEDARENLPNCTLTQMIGTFSFEALQTFLAKRLCDRAQLPIRTLAIEMRKQALAIVPWAGKILAVQCVLKGFCPETHPGSCPLHANNGGTFLGKDQLEEAAKDYRLKLKEN